MSPRLYPRVASSRHRRFCQSSAELRSLRALYAKFSLSVRLISYRLFISHFLDATFHAMRGSRSIHPLGCRRPRRRRRCTQRCVRQWRRQFTIFSLATTVCLLGGWMTVRRRKRCGGTNPSLSYRRMSDQNCIRLEATRFPFLAVIVCHSNGEQVTSTAPCDI